MTVVSLDRPVRVLLVDAHEIVRLGLSLVFERASWVDRCLVAESPAAAIRTVTGPAPEIALVSLSLGRADAVALGARLSSRGTRVLLLVGREPAAASALEEARGFACVCQHWSARQLLSAVRAAALGRTPPCPPAQRRAAALSPRERDVLELVATGATNQEIGRYLFLSPHTVKQHTSGVYRKLGARNRADAVQRAQALGLLDAASAAHRS